MPLTKHQTTKMNINMESQASLLLKTLKDAAQVAGTELSIITPAMNTFIAQNDAINEKLVSNINDYKRTADDRSDLVSEVLSFDVNGSRGKLGGYIKAFALNGTWTVYAQQYNRRKVAFVIQEKPLEKMVWCRRKCQEIMGDDPNAYTDSMDFYIKGFQHSLVANIQEYYDEHVGDVNFSAIWKSESMSFEALRENPLKNHDVWKFFFTDRTKVSIPKLVDNIEQALVYYRRNLIISERSKINNNNTSTTIQESENLREKGAGFLRREEELKLLKFATEKAGGDMETINQADVVNVDEFKEDTFVSDAKRFDEDSFMGTASDAIIQQEIEMAARNAAEQEISSDDDSSDSSDSDDSDDNDDGDEPVTKRKLVSDNQVAAKKQCVAVVADATPIKEMMEALVADVVDNNVPLITTLPPVCNGVEVE